VEAGEAWLLPAGRARSFYSPCGKQSCSPARRRCLRAAQHLDRKRLVEEQLTDVAPHVAARWLFDLLCRDPLGANAHPFDQLALCCHFGTDEGEARGLSLEQQSKPRRKVSRNEREMQWRTRVTSLKVSRTYSVIPIPSLDLAPWGLHLSSAQRARHRQPKRLNYRSGRTASAIASVGLHLLHGC
jgi:hypothetical protein